MLFNSLIFLGFLFIVCLIYPRLPHKAQNIFLILASYIFYACWDWRFVFLILFLTIANFAVGLKIYQSNNQNKKKTIFISGIIINLGILSFFKYFNFFTESAALFLSLLGLYPNIPFLKIILPIGISFYTFQVMTYSFDIYRGKLSPSPDLINFALFVCFFPQLLAGPIERAANMLPQIARPRLITRKQIISGANLVLLGYFKKVAIADTLAPVANKIFEAPNIMTSGELWTGVYAFTIQIYCDFSGYTDIARGVAMILGFHIMDNFNAPYLSRSATEFWRKWHISLSTWLRDYLYIPLGGNRSGRTRTYINLMITFLLCGLWHGAAWTFVVWGAAHGIYLVIHRIITGGGKIDLSWPEKLWGKLFTVGKIFVTFHIIALTWVLFKASTFSSAAQYYKGLFRIPHFNEFTMSVFFAGLLVLVIDLSQAYLKSETWLTDKSSHVLIRSAIISILFISIVASAMAHSGTVTPFIYFQF
jgi:D-alanyl-lipoteichoic acid acyltransferase DltB (MBOAT superfamily)